MSKQHFSFAIILSLTILTMAKEDRCLVNEPIPQTRYLSFNRTALNLTMQTSEKIPHRLANAVLKIYIKEIIGFTNVTVVGQPWDVAQVIENLSDHKFRVGKRIPPAMINLEVPIAPEFDVSFYMKSTADSVENYGDLLPPTRYGLFVPQHFQNHNLNWTYFLDPEQSRTFSLSDERSTIIDLAKNSRTNGFFCEQRYNCSNGIYTPERCRSVPGKCALLLTTFPWETGFIVDHIEELELFVEVIWIGDELQQTVRNIENKIRDENSSVVFLDWKPSHTLLADGQYSHVRMPDCDSLESSKTVGCKYEMIRVVKYGWSQLQRLARPVSQAFYNANFTLANFKELIHNYNMHKDVDGAACQWLQDHKAVWQGWSRNFNDNETLYIGGIFPVFSSKYNGEGIAIAAKMAIDAVNRNKTVLKNYDLALYRDDDGGCKPETVMRRFIDYIIVRKTYDRLIGVLGPACSEAVEPLAGISKQYHTPVISYRAEGSSFSDRKRYPYFFRTIGENRQYMHVYKQFFQKWGWHRVAAISEDGQKLTEYISHMESFLAENGIDYIANIKLPQKEEKPSLNLYLDELQNKRAKIIIADIDESIARPLICSAFQRGMTAKEGYVWFLPASLPHGWYDTSNDTDIHCSVENMLGALEGHFSVTHSSFAPDDAFMEENITVGAWRQNYEAECDRKAPRNIHMDETEDITSKFSGYAYDAVWAYALAIDELLKEYPAAISDLHNVFYAEKFVENIGKLNFDGVSGNIQFRGGSSRFSNIDVVQWVRDGSEIYANVVGVFHPNISDSKPEVTGGQLKLNETDIIWLNEDKKAPEDGTEKCTFQVLSDAFGIDCNKSFVVFNVLLFTSLAALLLAAFFFLKKRYQEMYKKQVMMSMGLTVLSAAGSSLDKWEIPRERIVINRKLGVGAFGTVYGGHALFDEEKGWTAVAVKTLKGGTTTEEKLDFLSEAEAMKRFDHKNIVKLLAVITKTEPVCTVMEIMLYGDLKNYLLARRHLVNERESEESDEVSSKKLTAMALDVARALSYLADLKYVHRDVACRNCLVNSNRVVKLGDFGMTRLIFDSDYYRFSRKGMLPVRWMAPESLGLGIFSQASDVWSFGVLLYEIITFCSIPYQGMSNHEVLDYVKTGNTIQLPRGIKPQLEGLIKACWTIDHKRRPHASEIAEFLANKPGLLTPCIDVPLESMQLDNSSQWLFLPETDGKVSVNLSGGNPRILQHQSSLTGLSTTPNIANSISTNLTYLSTEDERKADGSLIDDESASFI